MSRITATKSLICLLTGTLTMTALAQSSPSGVQIVNSRATTQPVPAHLVYRHFLGWVKARYDKDQAEEVTDRYHFAAPFAKDAGLENTDFDVILDEAQALDADLKRQDQKAVALIQVFRAQASAKARNGELLPQPPNMLELQQERDTLIQSHVSILHARLGSASSAKLDRYLSRAVAPHVSLKSIALPKPPAPPGTLPPLN